MNYTYDEIYDMDLAEYCTAHNTTLGELIERTEIDMLILKAHFEKLYPRGAIGYPPIGNAVYSTLKKKEKHLDRLLDWKNELEFKNEKL